MNQMEELYQKVAGDPALQVKFAEAIKEAEKVNREAVEKKLIAFAKDMGYEIKVAEMQSFFKELLESDNGALSEAELDMVAGGKSTSGSLNIMMSVFSLGYACLAASTMNTLKDNGSCDKLYE